ncbi:MAG: adenylosuccinate synthetase [archaeon]
MAVDLVIGAQRGDEGKGNFCAELGLNGDYSLAIRSASPQAGHSIYIEGKRIGIAHLPCAAVNPNLRILIGGGSFIDPKKLFYGGKETRPHTGEIIELQAEIPTLGLTPERLGIDFNAKLVTEHHKEVERASALMKLGSIGSGVNPAKHDLIDKKATFVSEDPELKKFATDTILEMNNALAQGKHILYETDHGIELCQHFGGYFPYNTARTINTSAYLGEVGLPPQAVRDVYLVIKPYITAVAKDAPLKNEITDQSTLEELLHTGGESGSISGRIRRVGRFDEESFKRAIMLSGATKIAISHLDLSQNAWKNTGFENDSKFLKYVYKLSSETLQKPKISLVCYGPEISDVRRIG